MKILQLSVHYAPNVGGVETHLTDLVSTLANKKNKVFVLTYRPLVAKAPWQMIEKLQNVTIFRLPWLPGFFYTFNNSPVIEFLYLTPGLFFVTPFTLLFFNPEVIHAHGLVAGFIGVFWGRVFRKRVVVSTHSLYHFPTSGLYFGFAKWIFSHADKTLCLSGQSVKEIEKLGVDSDKVVRFTYWIDTDVFKPVLPGKKLADWANKFVVLFVGRLVAEKGIRELLQAATLLDDSYLFVIVGDGPLAGEIVERTGDEKSNVLFYNKIDNRDLPMYYANASVVIVPSIHDEGFGRVLLESLSCGTPVIASNRGAIPEAIDKTVGELITVTPEQIAKSVRDLKRNAKKLADMKMHARPFAMQRYSSANVEEIIKAYSA